MVRKENGPRYFILVGDRPNWETAIEKKIWGFTENARGFWNTIEIGDLLAFYSTVPIKKIFGFAKITDKFKEDKLVWNDEKIFKRALWPFRIRFEILNLQSRIRTWLLRRISGL